MNRTSGYTHDLKCLICVLAAVVMAFPQLILADTFPIVLVSDFHFDPNYGTSEASGSACSSSSASITGTLTCDSPLALLTSVMADITANTPKESLMLFTGDWLRHDIEMNESLSAFTTVVGLVAKQRLRSGMTPLTSLGNNDFVPDHYLDVTQKEQTLITSYSSILANASLLSVDEAAAFNTAGYYYRDITSPRLRVIVLNTLLYNPSLDPPVNPLLNPDPLGQFAFLSSRLEDATKQDLPTVLMSHIPPTMNAYYCVVSPCKLYMKEEFLERYTAIVNKYKSIIRYQFYGHAHALSFLADTSVGVPGLIVPAVSPVFGNVPSYITCEYDDETVTFGSFKMRHMALGTGVWSTFSVNDEEHIDKLLGPLSTITETEATVRRLWTSQDAWNTYVVLHAGGQTGDMWKGATVDATTLRQRHLCSMLAFSEEEYDVCVTSDLGREVEHSISGGVIAVCIIAFLIGLGGMLYAFIHLRRMNLNGVPIPSHCEMQEGKVESDDVELVSREQI